MLSYCCPDLSIALSVNMEPELLDSVRFATAIGPELAPAFKGLLIASIFKEDVPAAPVFLLFYAATAYWVTCTWWTWWWCTWVTWWWWWTTVFWKTLISLPLSFDVEIGGDLRITGYYCWVAEFSGSLFVSGILTLKVSLFKIFWTSLGLCSIFCDIGVLDVAVFGFYPSGSEELLFRTEWRLDTCSGFAVGLRVAAFLPRKSLGLFSASSHGLGFLRLLFKLFYLFVVVVDCGGWVGD